MLSHRRLMELRAEIIPISLLLSPLLLLLLLLLVNQIPGPDYLGPPDERRQAGGSRHLAAAAGVSALELGNASAAGEQRDFRLAAASSSLGLPRLATSVYRSSDFVGVDLVGRRIESAAPADFAWARRSMKKKKKKRMARSQRLVAVPGMGEGGAAGWNDERRSVTVSREKREDDRPWMEGDYKGSKEFLRMHAFIVKDQEIRPCGTPADAVDVSRYYMCSGVIISENYVLTSASCILRAVFQHFYVTGDLSVVVGALQHNTYVIQMSRYEIHPRFNSNPDAVHYAQNNIALITLCCPIPQDALVVPKLPTHKFTDAGHVCYAGNCKLLTVIELPQNHCLVRPMKLRNVPSPMHVPIRHIDDSNVDSNLFDPFGKYKIKDLKCTVNRKKRQYDGSDILDWEVIRQEMLNENLSGETQKQVSQFVRSEMLGMLNELTETMTDDILTSSHINSLLQSILNENDELSSEQLHHKMPGLIRNKLMKTSLKKLHLLPTKIDRIGLDGPKNRTKNSSKEEPSSNSEDSSNNESLNNSEDSNNSESSNNSEDLNNNESLNKTQDVNNNESLNKTQDLNNNESLNNTQDLNNNQSLSNSEDLNNNKPLNNSEQVNNNESLNNAQDLNNNKSLNNSEDLNNNKSLNISEEVNKNKSLNNTEDLNNNKSLNISEEVNNNKSLNNTEDLNNNESSNKNEDINNKESLNNTATSKEDKKADKIDVPNNKESSTDDKLLDRKEVSSNSREILTEVPPTDNGTLNNKEPLKTNEDEKPVKDNEDIREGEASTNTEVSSNTESPDEKEKLTEDELLNASEVQKDQDSAAEGEEAKKDEAAADGEAADKEESPGNDEKPKEEEPADNADNSEDKEKPDNADNAEDKSSQSDTESKQDSSGSGGDSSASSGDKSNAEDKSAAEKKDKPPAAGLVTKCQQVPASEEDGDSASAKDSTGENKADGEAQKDDSASKTDSNSSSGPDSSLGPQLSTAMADNVYCPPLGSPVVSNSTLIAMIVYTCDDRQRWVEWKYVSIIHNIEWIRKKAKLIDGE